MPSQALPPVDNPIVKNLSYSLTAHIALTLTHEEAIEMKQDLERLPRLSRPLQYFSEMLTLIIESDVN